MKPFGKKAEKVYSAILKKINNGYYQDNPRLPTEKELCKEFLCCHNTVRKALTRLIVEKKIESKRGSGSYVKGYSNNSRSNIVSLMHLGSNESLTKIQDRILVHNHTLAFFSQNRSHWDLKAERKFLYQVCEQRHRAVLAFCSPLKPYNEDILAEIQATGTMVIHYEHYKCELPGENFVLPDYKQAGYLAATNFLLSGLKKIYFCGLEENVPYEFLLEAGFFQALNDNLENIVERKPFLQFGDKGNYFKIPRMGNEKDAVKRLDTFVTSLKPGTGILCSTTTRANIIILALKRHKIKVPEEVDVIGVDCLSDKQVDYAGKIIWFDRDKILKKALDAVFAVGTSSIREIIQPSLIS